MCVMALRYTVDNKGLQVVREQVKQMMKDTTGLFTVER